MGRACARRMRGAEKRRRRRIPIFPHAPARERRERSADRRRACGTASSRAHLRLLVSRWLAIVWQHGRLTWITNSSGPMLPIVPLLFAAPKYFAGELTLGETIQVAAAFVQVQAAISWIVDNYSRISEWLASAKRVMDMVNACEDIDEQLPRRASAARCSAGRAPTTGCGSASCACSIRSAARS